MGDIKLLDIYNNRFSLDTGISAQNINVSHIYA